MHKLYYIQRKAGSDLETVDQFDTRSEASRMVREYSLADPNALYYVSTRSCKGWR